MLSTEKLEWTVGGFKSKDSAQDYIYEPKSLKICIVATDMFDYHTVSQMFDILCSLGIHREYGPKIYNFEVQMGVTFE